MDKHDARYELGVEMGGWRRWSPTVEGGGQMEEDEFSVVDGGGHDDEGSNTDDDDKGDKSGTRGVMSF